MSNISIESAAPKDCINIKMSPVGGAGYKVSAEFQNYTEVIVLNSAQDFYFETLDEALNFIRESLGWRSTL